jgi:toxin YoeB
VRIIFSSRAWSDYTYWLDTDPKRLGRINGLIEECRRQPFAGTGKPEPLRGDLRGWWSRRITREDRMVYRVTGGESDRALEIAQLRFHY